jgi:acetyltransferase-like isoleucine patch superfamily enzyme
MKILRLSTTNSDGSVISYSARIVRTNPDNTIWVEIPARVRALPFPPYGGKRYAQFDLAVVGAQVVTR